jgi:Thylakoid formation protein
LVGAKIKTVGEAFAEFTRELGVSVNPLYKNMVTDLVGTTHLVVVNARFKRDPIWCLGIMTALDLLLKNYPEKDVGEMIVKALFQSVGMEESQVRAEAQKVTDWAKGKTQAEVEAALAGEGDSFVAALAKTIKADSADGFWMYSRFFGIGLVKIMELVGLEMDKDEVYPIMEDWMTNKLGRSSLTACVSQVMRCVLLAEIGSFALCCCLLASFYLRVLLWLPKSHRRTATCTLRSARRSAWPSDWKKRPRRLCVPRTGISKCRRKLMRKRNKLATRSAHKIDRPPV